MWRKNVWSTHACVSIVTRRKDISHDLREVVATPQSRKGYKAISKQFEIHYSTARRLFTNGVSKEESPRATPCDVKATPSIF